LFLVTQLLAAFKIALLSTSEYPSHFLSLKRKYLQVLTLRDALPKDGHSRAPSPGQSLKQKENEQISKGLNRLVPLISCLTT
jgi:hypothetical protein